MDADTEARNNLFELPRGGEASGEKPCNNTVKSANSPVERRRKYNESMRELIKNPD